MGRPREKSADDRKREGSYREDRHADTKVGSGRAPRCPSRLKGAERRAWSMLVGQVREAGVLSECDAGVLEAAAVTYVRAVEFGDFVRKLKPADRFVRGHGGLRAHPAIAEERAAWREFRLQAAALGLTPQARRALGAGEERKAADPLDAAIEQMQSMPLEPRA